jgi:hypothetical protein
VTAAGKRNKSANSCQNFRHSPFRGVETIRADELPNLVKVEANSAVTAQGATFIPATPEFLFQTHMPRLLSGRNMTARAMAVF